MEKVRKKKTGKISQIASIKQFRGKYGFLSNFWRCPVILDGCTYPSAENAYQALKCVHNADRKLFQDPTCFPSKAKRLGRKVQIREDWDSIRLEAMRMVIEAKFYHNQDLAQKLMDTGNAELVEGNTWNGTFWGECQSIGENHLGKILMEVREYLNELITEYQENLREEYENSILLVDSQSSWPSK